MADYSTYQNPLNGLLQSLLGGEIDQETNESSNTTGQQTNNSTSQVNQNQNQQTSGNTNTTTTGSTTGNTTSTSTQKSIADLSRLEEVYARQKAGVTPEMLAAIFSEGSKAVPGLAGAYANAVGARASGNSALGVALRDLNADLTNKAAVLNTQLLEQSGDTAAKIAELSKTMQTETQAASTENSSQSQAVQQLLNTILSGGTTTNTQGTQTNNQTTNSQKDLDQKQTMNTDVLKILGGLGIGGMMFPGAGSAIGGLLPQLGGLITGGLGKGLDWLQEALFDGTAGEWSQILPDVGFGDFDWLDYGENLDFGWKDGGKVTLPKSDGGYANGGVTARHQRSGDFSNVTYDSIGVAQGGIPPQLLQALGKATGVDYSKTYNNYEHAEHGSQMVQGAGNADVWKDLNSKGYTWGQNKIDGGKKSQWDVMDKSGKVIASKTFDTAPSGMMKFMQTVMPMAVGAVFGGGLSQMMGGALGGGSGSAGLVAGDGMSMAGNLGGKLAGKGINKGITSLIRGGMQSAGGKNTTGQAMMQQRMMQMQQLLPLLMLFGGRADGGEVGFSLGEDEVNDGMAEGGKLPKQEDDPKGIKDTMQVPLSGGEYIIPTDVVEALGEEFFDHLLDKYHVPAITQEHMSGEPAMQHFMSLMMADNSMAREKAATEEGKKPGMNDSKGVPLMDNMNNSFPMLMKQLGMPEQMPAPMPKGGIPARGLA